MLNIYEFFHDSEMESATTMLTTKLLLLLFEKRELF